MSIPTTMRAIHVGDDPARTLSWVETPCPQPGPGQVLIRIKATALNRADLLQRRGLYPVPPGASEILGLEAAGEIVHCGEQVHNWREGDRVCVLLEGGGYAEYVAVDEGMLLPIPTRFSYAEAAALPEVFYTAYLNLYIEARLHPKERVLVHAGASGVGTAAVQLCAALGNPVLATTSSAKLDAVRALGAEAVFDRGDPTMWDQLKAAGPIDVILDPVGASYLKGNLGLLNREGRLVVIGLLGGAAAELPLGLLLMRRLRVIGSVLRSRSRHEKVSLTRAMTEQVWPLFDTGALTPIIDSEYPIQEAEAAQTQMAENRSVGKIILSVP